MEPGRIRCAPVFFCISVGLAVSSHVVHILMELCTTVQAPDFVFCFDGGAGVGWPSGAQMLSICMPGLYSADCGAGQPFSGMSRLGLSFCSWSDFCFTPASSFFSCSKAADCTASCSFFGRNMI